MAESEENSNESLHSIHSDQSEKSDEEFFESRAVEPEQPTVGDGKVAPGEEDHEEEIGSDSLIWKNQHKHFFVLSEAGKPIYTRHGNEEQLVTLFGVMQALVSVIEDGEDSMETIFSGDTKFVFLHKSPLILVAVSKLRDSVVQLQLQLQ